MIEVIEYFSIILWAFYLYLVVKREILRKYILKDEYKKNMIINHPFHIIRIDSVFFLLVYIIYNDFADTRVMPYLYLIIIITNIVYVLYDLIDNYKNINIKAKEEYINYILYFSIIIVLIIYMLISKNIMKTYIYTLIINLLVPVIIWGVNKVIKFKK